MLSKNSELQLLISLYAGYRNFDLYLYAIQIQSL